MKLDRKFEGVLFKNKDGAQVPDVEPGELKDT